MKKHYSLEHYDNSVYQERQRQREIEERPIKARRENRTYWIAVAGLAIAALSLLWQILEKLL